MKIDALCLPSHKGLWGPQGSGALLLSEGVEVEGLIEGGSGVFSLEPTMPTSYPERLEAGTLPTPCIAAWRAGIDAVRRTGQNVIAERERSLTTYLQRRLQRIPRVRILAPHHSGSILLFYALGIPAERLGKELDKYGICVRAGFHCAALAHQTLGTPSDGAVRVSVGFDNTPEEMDALADALSRILLH
jgi:selenocysteine lyase/cysteine desulfurase